jgi:carbonic anhydrase
MLSGSAVTLSNDLRHLSVNVSSANRSMVSFYNAGAYTPRELRIYKPSLHKFNGAHADAELLIVHAASGSNRESNGLIVCVPIAMGGSNRSGLNNIIAAANTLNPGTLALTPSAPIPKVVDVNNFIPSKPFYVYNGTLPYESCGGNYYYAVFADPISIGTPILNLVPSEIKTASPPALLQKSKGGPVNSIKPTARDEYVLYEVVEDDDCGEDAEASGLSMPIPNPSSPPPGLNVVWGLLIAFVILLVRWVFTTDWGIKKSEEVVKVATAMIQIVKPTGQT